ncbi:MAG: cyclase family protein [Ignavibacteriae bacterium]|nr:MAG: cyclase family protein [Ignavibacteriota bacterium]
MEITLKIGRKSYKADLENPIDISIPLNFYGEQPNAYDADKASAKPVETGNFIGDTRMGGSCNFEEYKFIPHCNGTHTECVGHIADERISIHDTLKDTFIPALLVSVYPERAFDSVDIYSPIKEESDMLISRKVLEDVLKNTDIDFHKALIVRTLPNDESKKSKRYMEHPHPFFSIDAMSYVKSLGVKHLLIDTPSIDRMFDEGYLSAHHIFWEVEEESHDVDKNNHSLNTVTEMIYVPDDVHDGNYLLNLQITGFIADASPSRPVLIKLKSEN